MNTGIEIIRNSESCYKPLVDFEAWRVAGLNHCDIVDIAHLTRVERHLESDEVFVLMTGRASLIVENTAGEGAAGEGGPAGGKSFDVIPMEPNTVYNIKRGVYHHVIMDKDASIIIVENSDTTAGNSEYRELSGNEIQHIQRRVQSNL